MKTNYAKAYTEVLQILKYLPKDEFSKIPKEKITFYEENADKNHEFKYNPSKELYNQKVLRETNVIIVKLYNDYFANDNQKQTLKKILHENELEYQEKLREKYNPDDIFKNKTNEEKVNDKVEESEINEIMKLKKKSFLEKIIEKLKGFFGKK